MANDLAQWAKRNETALFLTAAGAGTLASAVSSETAQKAIAAVGGLVALGGAALLADDAVGTDLPPSETTDTSPTTIVVEETTTGQTLTDAMV